MAAGAEKTDIKRPACPGAREAGRIIPRTQPDPVVVTGIAMLTSTIPQPTPKPSIEDLQRAMSDGDQLERNGMDDGASCS